MVSLKKNIAISDSGFVFNPSNGDSFSLNQIGLDMLLQLKEAQSEEQVKAAIMAKYDIDRDSLDNDYYDFLKMLGQFKLLELS
ncbi:MAG: PqqD family protein [Flavobacteriales bacterium]|nr:PqqD family protein [Flavobacteriales bacterium]